MAGIAGAGLHFKSSNVDVVSIRHPLTAQPIHDLVVAQELAEVVLLGAQQLCHLTEPLKSGRLDVLVDELNLWRGYGQLLGLLLDLLLLVGGEAQGIGKRFRERCWLAVFLFLPAINQRRGELGRKLGNHYETVTFANLEQPNSLA